MGKHVRPVRAWAEYEKYLMCLDTTIATWRSYLIPMTGEGVPHASGGSSIVACIGRMNVGPLRSLRVLYENGYELRLERLVGRSHLSLAGKWFWYLHRNQDDPQIANGTFAEDKDSEAVERAMIAAATWFTQAEGLDT